MRRRPSTPSVTLFPFLAVLVCTMGALIFLLLVITQKIQKQSQLPLVSIERVDVTEEVPEPLQVEQPAFSSFVPLLEPDIDDVPISVPFEFDEDEPILPLLAGNSIEDHEWLKREWKAKQIARRELFARKVAERVQQQQELDKKLKKDAEVISSKLLEQQRKKEELMALLQRKQNELSLLDEKQESIETKAELTLKQLAEAQLLHRREQEKRFQLQAQAAELTRQIARLEEQNAQALPETKIVAYDSLTGTSRKPILIECRQSEIVFASEGVVLSATDLSGFPPEYNPLKAGAEALLEYWKEHGQPHERPYLLLVVRPEGTTGFYVARGLLSELDHQFGYELVETDRAILWPENDSAAMKACQAAVFSVLNERDRVASRLGRLATLHGGPLSYANRQGDFQLPDAGSTDRNNGENFFGDEKWVSPKRRRSETTTTPSPVDRSPLQVPRAVPRSIARPAPSEMAQPLFENDSNGSKVIKIPTHTSPSESDSKRFSEQNRTSGKSGTNRSVQQSPNQFNAQDSKPLMFPNSAMSRPQNPFDSQQTETEEKKPAQHGIQIASPRNKGGIGIERETELHLWQNEFQIDDGARLNIPKGADTVELKTAVTAAIGKVTSEWEPAPKAYFWKPVVKIVIHPGGLLHYAPVKELTDSWKVPTRVEHEIQ